MSQSSLVFHELMVGVGPATLLALVALGAFAGFLAGLFGIGGGMLMVPMLVMIFSGRGLSADEALELTTIYRASGMQGAYQNLAMRLASDPGFPPQHLLALAGLFAQDQRIDALIFSLEQYTQRETGNLDVWLDLAAAYAFVRRDADAVHAARKAIELGGDQAREAIMRDARFQPLASNGDFRALFPRQAPPPVAVPWQGGALPNLPGLAR